MGSITEAGSVEGSIFLQTDITQEFKKTLKSTKHADANTFLEHLLGLFLSADADTRALKVRLDVAQKFAALQNLAKFPSSNELMKHLLQLHIKSDGQSSSSMPKSSQTKAQTAAQPSVQSATATGRRGRKSQPKRNYVHAALIDSDEESGIAGGPSGRDDVTGAVTDNDGSVSQTNGASIRSMGPVAMETTFDITKVKQEVDDDSEAMIKSKQNDKDSRLDSNLLCLSLHKPMSVRDAARMRPDNVITAEEAKKNLLHLDSRNASGIRTARQFTQANWRSRSEPVDHDLHQRPRVHEPVSLQASPQDRLLENKMAAASSENTLGDELRNGYNYVLNSLAPSPGPEGSSLPRSPMQLPVKHEKSNTYTISSGEDEPEDLSLGSANEQPHNLSLSKPQGQLSGFAKAGDIKNAVKYDSNANAVASPLAQLQNGQILAQTQIPIPQNLIFHDPRSVSTVVGLPPALMKMASNAQVSLGDGTGNSAPTMLLSSQAPPPLKPSGMRGPPPLMLNPALISPTSSSQILMPVGAVVSPTTISEPSTPNASLSEDNQNSDSSRKRRKKMDDTTSFRDPPEQSLPFNGPNKYRFYCDVCDTGFTRRYTFNRHKCKGRVEKHYCQLCDKAYLSKYKLKDHILVKHEGQTVSCPECGKRFSSRSSMEMHKKQQHEGQFSIFCKICGKGFNHTGHYYGHMNKHTNTKPFWCQQCGKRFFGSSYLHNHKQVCRGNSDLNYACNICDRKFKCELYLKKHMKIHDNTPIIANPNVAKLSDEDLAKAGVYIGDCDIDADSSNGDSFMSQPIFPNGPDLSDSNSNSLMIDDEMHKVEGNNNDAGVDMSVS